MTIIAKRETSTGGCCNSSTSTYIHRWGLDWKGEKELEKDGEEQRREERERKRESESEHLS